MSPSNLAKPVLALGLLLAAGAPAIATVTNLSSQADVDIRSLGTEADIGYNRTVLLVGNRDVDPNAAEDAKAYIRFQLPADFGTATSATLTLTRAVVGAYGWTYSVYGLNDGPVAGSSWTSLTWPEVNGGNSTTATTWNNAPGNVTNSATDFTSSSLIGTFTTKSAAAGGVAGDQYSITGAGLLNFVNGASNLFLTQMVSRAGVSSSSDQWASKENTNYPGPILTLDYIPTTLDPKQVAAQRWSAWKNQRTNYFTAAWQALYRYTGTASEYQTYHDANLNSVQTPFNEFEVASSAGLDVILGSWEGIDVNSAKLASYVVFPSPGSRSVTAYLLKDEPPASDFPALANSTAYIYRCDARSAIPIVDQLPNWAVTYDRFGLGKADGSYYTTYINKYVRDVAPCVMLNDHYPIFANGTDSTNYYDNIEYFRKLALTNDIGLMGFALVTAHTNGSIVYRQPSESDLNWMVYSYVAYGAAGMFYYNYRFAPSAKYGEGLVTDLDDMPRPTYYLVRDVGQELDHIWPVFKHLQSVSVFHADTNVPFSTTRYTNGASSAIRFFTGTNFIIGTFTNRDDPADMGQYVVMVNKRHGLGSYSSNLTCTATFTPYDTRPHVSLFDPANGSEVSLAPSAGQFDVAAGGGKGVLLKFRPFAPVETWAAGYGLSGTNADATADPDGDHASNLYEFAFGGNPTNANLTGMSPTFQMVVESGTNWLQYVYRRRTDPGSGLTYHLDLTGDLASGSWTNSGYTETGVGAIDTHFESVTNRIAVTGNHSLFIRLRVVAGT